MIWDYSWCYPEIGEALVKRHQIRAHLAILIDLGSAIQNALVNLGQAILKNQLLLFQFISQPFYFLLQKFLRFGTSCFWDLHSNLMQHSH